MFLGIIHLAGSTGGNAEILCDNPLQYPVFLPVVLPLYLSTVASYMQYVQTKTAKGNPLQKWPNKSEILSSIKYKFTNSCNEAVETITKALELQSLSVKYNAGRGRFVWPPSLY